jgi:hypothetical protein
MSIPVIVAMAIPLNDRARSPELLIAPVDVVADAAGSDAGLPELMIPHADVRGVIDGVDAIAGAMIPDAVAPADMPDMAMVIFADARALADDIPTCPASEGGPTENASVPHEAASDMPDIATESDSAKTPVAVAVVDDDPAAAADVFVAIGPDDIAADTPISTNVRDIVPVDAVAVDPTSATAGDEDIVPADVTAEETGRADIVACAETRVPVDPVADIATNATA